MAATIHEHALSRKGKQSYLSPSIMTKWIVMGTGSAVDGDGNPVDEVQEVIDLVEDENNVPKTYGALLLQDYSYEPQGGGIWSVEVNYERSKDRYEVSIDTTGHQSKRIVAIETAGYDANLPGADAPDNGNLIGEQDDKVEGVNTIIPGLKLTIQLSLRFTTMEAGYVKKLYDYTGKTNDAPCSLYWEDQELIFDTEELLFEGAQMRKTSEDELNVTFKFEASKSDPAIQIGEIEVSKPGWRYLDVKVAHISNTIPNSTKKTRTMFPQWVRVHKVYRTADFADLMVFNGN